MIDTKFKLIKIKVFTVITMILLLKKLKNFVFTSHDFHLELSRIDITLLFKLIFLNVVIFLEESYPFLTLPKSSLVHLI